MDYFLARSNYLPLNHSRTYGASFGNERSERASLRSYSSGPSSLAPSLEATNVHYRNGFSAIEPSLRKAYEKFCNGISSFIPSLKAAHENYGPFKSPSPKPTQHQDDISQNRACKKGDFPKIVCATSGAKAKTCDPSMPQKAMKKKKSHRVNPQVAARKVYLENQRLQMEGIRLRHKIRSIRQESFEECNNYLKRLRNYRAAKAEKGIPVTCAPLPSMVLGECKPNRVATGCSKGGCGGYTPSGWNKLKTLREKDYCCPLPCDLDPCCKQARADTDKCDAVACHAGVADCLNRPSVRILGELAFQLERRILDYVFGNVGCKQTRVYGYTVNDICDMLEKECCAPCGATDVTSRTDMACRLRTILRYLCNCGYNVKCHGDFAQEMIEKYGVLSCPPSQCTIQMFGLHDPCAISCLINKLCRSHYETHHLNILLNSLRYLSECDGRPLFVW